MNTQTFNQYLIDHRARLLEDFKDFLRQPSVAATGQGIVEMAAIVARRLATLGADVKIVPTEGNAPPVVWAELGQGDKTLLIYNHYDVQPAEPFDLWESPPFEPTVRNDHLFARGVSDNKGELITRIHAVEAWQATQAGAPLPCKIKWLVEGEEEIGSPHLHSWVEAHKDWLQADGCLWEGGGFDEKNRFELHMGVKGICYVELSVKSIDHDLHSATAALAPNAAWRLTWALSTLKDANERILIDGYNDHVRAPNAAEEAMLRKLPYEEQAIKTLWGITNFVAGATGYDAVKRMYFAPTCTICGLTSGWQGAGTKTVLPAEAKAKVDFRLVPDLSPEIVIDLLRKHLDKHGFQDVQIKQLGGYKPALSDVTAPVVRAAELACQRTYNQSPLMYPLMAGSGPMWSLSTYIGVPAVMAGIGSPGDRIHSPNENISLQNYHDGMRYIGALLEAFAKA